MNNMRVAGLFAGIGGVERGFELAGLQSTLLCEIDPAAQSVLRSRFPKVRMHSDVRTLESLPDVEVVAAGFPCQDLSQAGRTAGIKGNNSGLVSEVFRLLDSSGPSTLKWVVLENVPFMLQLDAGRGMTHLVNELEDRGFTWAYRVVDTRAFGLPQRRRRVLLVASRVEDPCGVLFSGNESATEWEDDASLAFGFYWTEGSRGLGAAIDAVPTLKGGSTIGIPSPPAILMPSGDVVTPDIRDAERLQGFPVDWTSPAATDSTRKNARWKLVGNAVSVPVAAWLGRQLAAPGSYVRDLDQPFVRGRRKWPIAAWGRLINGKRETYFTDFTSWPARERYQHLHQFLRFESPRLSARATAGFLDRLNRSSLTCYPPDFKDQLAAHLQRMQERPCSVSDSSRAALQSQA